MIPIKMQIKGFLSYQDRATIDFTGLDLACITGSNGAGKSSLLDAMTWALFGQARKRDDSVINNYSEYAEVEFEFSYEGNHYRILRAKHRDKPTILEFHIQAANTWKPLTEKSVRDTEDRICETLKMDYDVFINASFFLQGKADQFTQQRPGDRKKILSSILGLDSWEGYRLNAVEHRKKTEESLSLLDGRMQEIQAELNESITRHQALENLNNQTQDLTKAKEAQRKLVESLKKDQDRVDEIKLSAADLEHKIASSRKSLEDLSGKLGNLNRQKEEADTILAQSESIERQAEELKDIQIKLQEMDSLSSKFTDQQMLRQSLVAKIDKERSNLEQEYKSLSVANEEVSLAQQEAEPLKQKLDKSKSIIAEYDSVIESFGDVETQLADAIKRAADARAENPRLKQEMDNLKQQIETLESEESPDCPFCGHEICAGEKDALIEKLKSEGKKMGDRYRNNSSFLSNAEETVKSLEKKSKDLGVAKTSKSREETTAVQFSTRLQSFTELIGKWETSNQARFNEVKSLLDNDNFALDSRQNLKDLESEMIATGYDPNLHSTLREAASKANVVNQAVITLEKARSTAEQVGPQITFTRQQIEEKDADVKNSVSLLAELERKLGEMANGTNGYADAVSDLAVIEKRDNELRMELGAAKQKVDVLKVLKERLEKMAKEREEISKTIENIKTLERAFGKNGVPALLIEQALPEIENKANEILNKLSGGDMRVRFITQAAYKDDKREDMKETLDIQISDPVGTREYEMFSGGESFRVNFAVRLALAEVLSQRAGAKLQMLVIDEGFGSQDSQGRQRLLEAINLVRKDFSKILVITHIEELKDAFPHQIEVEKTPTGTQLKAK